MICILTQGMFQLAGLELYNSEATRRRGTDAKDIASSHPRVIASPSGKVGLKHA
jgi:hypothetical protein